MSWQVLQGDARQIPLANESVHMVCTSVPFYGLRELDEKLTFIIVSTVNPVMTWAAKCYQVCFIESAIFTSCPRVNVVGVHIFLLKFTSSSPLPVNFSASLASVVIPFKNITSNLFPQAGSIHALSFGRRSALVIRITDSRTSAHAVMRTSQIRLRTRCFFAQYFFRFFGMFLTQKCWHCAGLIPMIVFSLQVVSSRPSWNLKFFQLCVNYRRISFDYVCDVIGGKSFNNIFLNQPVTVKM